MKLSFSKLVFETFYLLTILIVGVGSGLFASKMGVYYLVSKAGFIDGIFNRIVP